MSTSQHSAPAETWLYDLLVSMEGRRERPKVRKLRSATILYAVLVIAMLVVGLVIVMVLAADPGQRERLRLLYGNQTSVEIQRLRQELR